MRTKRTKKEEEDEPPKPRAPRLGPDPAAVAALGRDPLLLAPSLAAPSLVAMAATVSARALALEPPGSDPARPLLVLVPDASYAIDLVEAVRPFLGAEASLLEPWDILPFEPSSLEPAQAGARIEALLALLAGRLHHPAHPRVVVAAARAVARRIIDPALWRRHAMRLAFAEELPPARLRENLAALGYRAVPEVSEPGEFAVRGGLLDLFSPALTQPVRVEWDGDLVENIRFFDVETQRSTDEIHEVLIHPPRELLLPDSAHELEAAAKSVAKAVRPSLRRDRFLAALADRAPVEGLEVFQPFFTPMVSLLDSPGLNIVLVDEGEVRRRIEEAWTEAEREAGESDVGYDPSMLWLKSLPPLPGAPRLYPFPGPDVPVVTTEPLPPSPLDARILRVDLWRLAERGLHTTCVTTMPQRVEELLHAEKFSSPSLAVLDGTLISGAILPASGLAIAGEADLFGHRRRRTRGGRSRRALADWGALKDGDYVVHVHHGVGLFRGIQRIKTLGELKDVVVIEYAGGDRIYLPPHETDLVDRYTVLEGVTPRLDRLGGSGWTKVREKAERETAEIARELLDLYALRAAARGRECGPVDDEESFALAFGYDETEDQARAIEEVLGDLGAPATKDGKGRAPMDRLVCGDVGFGKTEVALRAVFRALRHGRQVAVLCPTTILALQHTETFRGRLAPFGIRTATLSRFQSTAEVRETLADLAAGRVQVVVGTHRLLAKDVAFRDLGLVVIDEEQRFGVKHKEQLKNLRRQVDILVLSATPIPRTLHLALAGARALSVISTPPPGRAPVQTIVEPFREEHVKRAIRRELDRGGQVFYVHNAIESIDRVHEFLRRLFPKVTIAIGHGQMKEAELASTMRGFLSGEISILICTAIIENGLDIPRANTIIIDRAERFGLSALYQLRGRVGRSSVKAYALFFHAPIETLGEGAKARLAAIAEHTALGSGYAIARRDMEIRGAGEILGVSQSGEMEQVGYDMYCRLLREAMADLRGETTQSSRRRVRPAVDLALPAFVPSEWLGGEELVGAVHREIAAAETVAAIDEVRDSLQDRFGALPEPVENLLTIARLRAYAVMAGVTAISETQTEVQITWQRLPSGLVEYLDQLPQPISAGVSDKTVVLAGLPPGRDRLTWVRRLVRR